MSSYQAANLKLTDVILEALAPFRRAQSPMRVSAARC